MTSLYITMIMTSLCYHNMTSLHHRSLYHNATEDVKAKNVAQCNIHMQATPHMLTTTLMHLNSYIYIYIHIYIYIYHNYGTNHSSYTYAALILVYNSFYLRSSNPLTLN